MLVSCSVQLCASAALFTLGPCMVWRVCLGVGGCSVLSTHKFRSQLFGTWVCRQTHNVGQREYVLGSVAIEQAPKNVACLLAWLYRRVREMFRVYQARASQLHFRHARSAISEEATMHGAAECFWSACSRLQRTCSCCRLDSCRSFRKRPRHHEAAGGL